MKTVRHLTAAEAAALLERQQANLAHLMSIRLQIKAELARRSMRLAELAALKEHDVIEFDKLAGESFDLLVNDHPFAAGELVVVGELMAVRVTRLAAVNPAMPQLTGPEPVLVNGPAAMAAAPTAEDFEAVAELQRVTEALGALRQDSGEECIAADSRRVELERRRLEVLPAANRQRMALIPAGPFTMGGSDEDSPPGERPAHTVHLPPYYLSPFPVTNQDYEEFVACTGHPAPGHWPWPIETARHPVVNVSWSDACAYAAWAGARLPTEAEWEKAARGTDERPYPWGTRFVQEERCNCNNAIGTTAPVDQFPAGRSPYGLWDMAGNVYEWCADCFDPDYYRRSPGIAPRGPEVGEERVVRGGCFRDARATVRTTHRTGLAAHARRETVGFRLAMDA